MDGPWASGVRVKKEGTGLRQVWNRQVQQLNRVSVAVATAVTTAYPSPHLLLQVGCSESSTRVDTLTAFIMWPHFWVCNCCGASDVLVNVSIHVPTKSYLSVGMFVCKLPLRPKLNSLKIGHLTTNIQTINCSVVCCRPIWVWTQRSCGGSYWLTSLWCPREKKEELDPISHPEYTAVSLSKTQRWVWTSPVLLAWLTSLKSLSTKTLWNLFANVYKLPQVYKMATKVR